MSIHTPALPFRRHALALALALATGAAPAATINVSGACTLINAINNANSDTDTDGDGGCPAGSGADTLELTAKGLYTLTAADNTTQGPTGLPAISSVVTINGNEATVERSGLAGTPYFRLLYITPAGNLTINQLTLTGGKLEQQRLAGYASQGGGIFNQGILNLDHSTITDNGAYNTGGILNSPSAHLTLSNSTISGNNAIQGGGGITNAYGFPGGYATLTNSSISGNSASFFGCILNSGQMTLTNSTISNNTGSSICVDNVGRGASLSIDNSTISGNEGGIRNQALYGQGNITMTNSTFSGNNGSITNHHGQVLLTNSTVSGNSVQGIFNSARRGCYKLSCYSNYGGSVITLTNTVVANNAGGDCYAADSLDTVTTLQGVNLIKDGSCGAPLSSDPKLRTLLDNGGSTLTHALKVDSPAIAAADPTFCKTTDQRDVKRPPFCDLGAFERKTRIPQSIAPLVQFLDAQVASGQITGNTPGQKLDQRIALRNQLLTAGDYRNRHLNTEACDQLTRTLGYIDPDNTPEADDYVTGSGGGLLTDEINALRSDWSCS